jgi:hypothetical protein
MSCCFFIFRLSCNLSKTFLFAARGTRNCEHSFYGIARPPPVRRRTHQHQPPLVYVRLQQWVSIWQNCSAALREFDIQSTFLGRVLPPTVFFGPQSTITTASDGGNRSELMIVFLIVCSCMKFLPVSHNSTYCGPAFSKGVSPVSLHQSTRHTSPNQTN